MYGIRWLYDLDPPLNAYRGDMTLQFGWVDKRLSWIQGCIVLK